MKRYQVSLIKVLSILIIASMILPNISVFGMLIIASAKEANSQKEKPLEFTTSLWRTVPWKGEDYDVYKVEEGGEVIGLYVLDDQGDRVDDKNLEALVIYHAESNDIFENIPQAIETPNHSQFIFPGEDYTKTQESHFDPPFVNYEFDLYTSKFLDFEDDCTFCATRKEIILGTDGFNAGVGLQSEITREKYYGGVIFALVMQDMIMQPERDTNDPVELAKMSERLDQVSEFIKNTEAYAYENNIVLNQNTKDLLESMKSLQGTYKHDLTNDDLAKVFGAAQGAFDLTGHAIEATVSGFSGHNIPFLGVISARLDQLAWQEDVAAGAVFAMIEHVIALGEASQRMLDIEEWASVLPADTDTAIIEGVVLAREKFDELIEVEFDAFEHSADNPENLTSHALWVAEYTAAIVGGIATILIWIFGATAAGGIFPPIALGAAIVGIALVGFQLIRPSLEEQQAYERAWYETSLAYGFSVFLTENLPDPTGDLRLYLSLNNMAWFSRAYYYDKLYWLTSYSHNDQDWLFNDGGTPTRHVVENDSDIGRIKTMGFVYMSNYGQWVHPNDRQDLYGLIIPNLTDPQLTNPSRDPAGTGFPSTSFEFSIDFSNPDNQPPDSISIHIDSQTHALQEDSNSYLAGALYKKSVSGFSIGTHQYYYTAVIGSDNLRYPETGTLSFDVVTSNTAPTINLLTPNNEEAFRYFYIDWTDNDPDDNAFITLGYDTNNSGCDGITIQQWISEDWTTDTWTWRNIPKGGGPYWVYAIIEDEYHNPVCEYSPGTITIESAIESENYAIDHTEIDDSDEGDSDGIWESGEEIELKVYIENASTSTLTDVFGVLNTTNDFITLLDNDSMIWSSEPGIVRSGTFDLIADEDFSGNVEFFLDIYHRDETGDLFVDREEFSVVISDSGAVPNFSISDITYDDSDLTEADNDGLPESGEDDIDVYIELTNSGATASNVTGIITTQPVQVPGLWFDDEADYPDMPSGTTAAIDGDPFEIDDLPVDFSGTVDQILTVYYGVDQQFSQNIPFQITLHSTPRIRIQDRYYSFGQVSPGDPVTHDFDVWNMGTETAVIDSIVGSRPELTFPTVPTTIAPGATETLSISFDTTGLNESVEMTFTINSNAHLLSNNVGTISGTVADIHPAGIELFGTYPLNNVENVSAGDTDGDGIVEVVAVEYIYGDVDDRTQIHLYELDGPNSFSEVWNSGTTVLNDGGGDSYISMAIGDVNGDNLDDVVFASEGWSGDPDPDKIYLFSTNGNNSLSLLWSTNLQSQAVAIGDADGDGLKEIIVTTDTDNATHMSKVLMYEWNGTGMTLRWSSPSIYEEWSSSPDPMDLCGTTIVDSDLDGNYEIIVGSEDGYMIIFERTGNNSFSQRWKSRVKPDSFGDDPCMIATGDLDQDSYPEIAYGDDDDGFMMVIEASANNSWSIVRSFEVTDPTSRKPTFLYATDLDLDGDGEWIVGTDAGTDDPNLLLYEVISDNSYAEIWRSPSTSGANDDVLGIDVLNSNDNPYWEFVASTKDDEWYLYGLVGPKDLIILNADISFSDDTPEEGQIIDLDASVTNSALISLNDVKVDFYLGDPDSGGIFLCTDTITEITAGDSGLASCQTSFTDAGSKDIYVLVDPDDTIPGEVSDANNKAQKTLIVYDDDLTSPDVNITEIAEHNGDGDGYIENDEEVSVTWTAVDSSGIKDTYLISTCTIVSTQSLPNDTYQSILGPCPVNTHSVAAYAEDNDNSSLSEETNPEYFTSHYDQPEIDSTSPEDQDNDVLINSAIYIWFYNELSASTLNHDTFKLKDSQNSEVFGSIYYSEDLNRMVFTPYNPLAEGETYQATLFGGVNGIEDAIGNEMPSDYVWSFTTKPPAPDIEVEGLGQTIINGDSNPSILDDTDFGTVKLGGQPVTHTFTIENTGTQILNLTGSPTIQVSGTHASDFTVTSDPSSSIAASGGYSTFSVEFEPSGDGLREATISIQNNDPDENPYTFAVKGLGQAGTFSDVTTTHWAYLYVESIADAGLTGGYPDGTYRPENRVTRAEMAVFLLNALGITPGPLPVESSFNDIPGHWAETFIEELKDQGITGGYPDGTYRPENRVTRAEMAVFLLKGMGVTPPPIDGSHPFSDIEGHWAEIFIEELEDQGITGGYPDGTYRPENRVTRAEMAVFLVNAFGIPLP